MRHGVYVSVALLALAGPALAQSADPRQAPTGSYALETRHSQVLFAIPHLGITEYFGRFDKLSGTLTYNAASPEKSAVNITIDMTSIDTPSHELMGELMGAGVFDTAKYPTATFKSTSVTRTGANTGTISGELTLHGVTKPVKLDVTFGGVTSDPVSGADDIGFHATATVKRTDFGITGMVWESYVGDDVKLTIEAMFQHRKN
ncbi:MAG: YceI family protein [Alphaproteobacteria bacterium]|nr:YceI family protein [Alphaproteobacteria bacterium]MBV9693245.1 YceI family protein [Alphaproteobacteria bacterium]